jgi:RND family efflux transporter MFP subunit
MKIAIGVVLIGSALAIGWFVAPWYLTADAIDGGPAPVAHAAIDDVGARRDFDAGMPHPPTDFDAEQHKPAATGTLRADGNPVADSAALSPLSVRQTPAQQARSSLWGGGLANPRMRDSQLMGCLIEPDQSADVGSPVVGVVDSIRVERGDRVKRGQVLARLRADVERASVEVADARARAEADVRAAQTNLEFLRQKQARAEELVAKNFISQQALDQARADTKVAHEKLAQALEQQSIWQRELDLANAQFQMRLIRAPFDGVVADRYITVGERIEEKPMFRVVKVDPLRVEMVAPAALFGTVSAGAVAAVTPDLRDATAMPAKVVLVDPVIDGASNTFRVRAQLANEGGALPSGLRCRAELNVQPISAAAKPAAKPRGDPAAGTVQVAFKIDSQLSSIKGETAAAPAKP